MKGTARGPVWLLCATGLAAGTVTAQEPIDIKGVSVTRTIDCAGGAVVVTGTSHNLTLTGRCPRVTLSGTASVVHIGSLGRLTVSGMNHRVEWETGLDGKDPVVQNSGINNQVVKAKGGATSGSASSGTRAQAGSASVETGAGGVVVSSGSSRVTVGESGAVSVESTGAGAQKDKVTVNAGGTSVAVDGTAGTVHVGTGAAGSATKGTTVNVVDSDGERTLDCGGGTANVAGGENVLTLRNCSVLVVGGSENVITLQGPVSSIRLLGNENAVTWSQGAGGKPPSVEMVGSGNTVKRSGAN
jgi:DUF3060 family protein